jgi:hypothetical protein
VRAIHLRRVLHLFGRFCVPEVPICLAGEPITNCAPAACALLGFRRAFVPSLLSQAQALFHSPGELRLRGACSGGGAAPRRGAGRRGAHSATMTPPS